MDSGFDAARLMSCIESCNQGGMGSAANAGAVQVNFPIKWNPRSTDVAALATRLGDDPTTHWDQQYAGKRATTWERAVTVDGVQRPVRRALRVPELTLDGWTTSLPAHLGAQDVIGLYADHGTHEQFHSEFKTDLDLTRLRPGKFDTNDLVCQLAAVAMNILRLIGQRGLLGPDSPVRHKSQVTSNQDGYAGADLPRRAVDPDGSQARPGAGRTRPRGPGLHALVRTVRRYRVCQPARGPRA